MPHTWDHCCLPDLSEERKVKFKMNLAVLAMREKNVERVNGSSHGC